MQNFYAPPTNPRLERFKLFLNDPFLRKDPQSTLSYNIQQYIEHVTHPERDRAHSPYSSNQNAQGNYMGQQGYNNEGFNSQFPIANRMYNDGDEKYMNDLVNMLNQGINKYEQNVNNRGSLNNSRGNYDARNDSLQSLDNRGGYFQPQEPLFRAPESSIPRHNESRYIEQARPEYPSMLNRPSDPYQLIDMLEQENRKLMNQIDLQNTRFRSLENENRVLRERVDAQEATVRSLDAECIQLRQELARGGGGMFASQRSYGGGGQYDGNYSDKKKLIQDNEQLVLQVSQLRREKTQAQNMLSVKENEFSQLPMLQSQMKHLEAEMAKKNEAIFTLGDMLKLEKIKSAELNENFKTLETAFQQSFGTVPQLPFPYQSNQLNNLSQGIDSIPRTQTMTITQLNQKLQQSNISQQNQNLQQSTLPAQQSMTNPQQNIRTQQSTVPVQQSVNNVQQNTVPVQQDQFQQQGMMSTQQNQQQRQVNSSNPQAQVQQQLYNQNHNQQQQQQLSNPNQQSQMMASNIQGQQQSYNPNQQQHQQQAPYNEVSNLKAQLEQLNQGAQPERGMNGQQVSPHNGNQTVLSPGLNTPIFNNKSGNLIVQSPVPQGQENMVRQPVDLVGSRVPFPSINELPEAIRLSLQGSIKTLLQMNGGISTTTTTTTAKGKSPTKTSGSATKAKPVSSASPQTNAY